MSLSTYDEACMRAAILQALEAGNNKNLPIGAVISLDQRIIALGKNTIWQPQLSQSRHAEMEALAKIPSELAKKSHQMTLYTTLEPCLMCLGAILLHGIGRIVFGSVDPFGGAVANPGKLPPFFEDRFLAAEWIGPAYPIECDSLYQQVMQLENLPGQKTKPEKQ